MIVPIFMSGSGSIVFIIIGLWLINALENENFGDAECTSFLGHSFETLNVYGEKWGSERICKRCGLIQKYGDDEFFGIDEGWYDYGQAEDIKAYIKEKKEHKIRYRKKTKQIQKERENRTRKNILKVKPSEDEQK